MADDPNRFEDPIIAIEKEIEELQSFGQPEKYEKKIQKLSDKLADLRKEVYGDLSRWQKVLVARNPKRPYTLDYIEGLMEDFQELHGDRRFSEDPAIVGGLARFRGRPVVVIGHQKGRVTKEKIRRRFGMPLPDGYRKALRLMKMGEKFQMPVITFIDTPGAYPGLESEERGQGEAIAVNLFEMAQMETPIIATVTGEGGSGGALALGVADRVNILQYSIYSVISPEGCASILWKDAAFAKDAAEALRLTSADLKKLGLVDDIIEEPVGGAHADTAATIQSVGDTIEAQIKELTALDKETLVNQRYDKFRAMGFFEEA